MVPLPVLFFPLWAIAALQPQTPSQSCQSRRAVVGNAFAAFAAVSAAPVLAEDKVVPKNKVGVTPGGVKYFDKVPGSCSPFNPCVPQAGDLVKIKYKAYLSNGQMFDSSEGPGRKPLAAKYKATPPQLLPGWEEALETMEQGSTRIIQVPANLAYGEKGVKVETKDGSVEYLVPPNEKLQYELTLIQVALPPP
ncbi:fkbp-type peptidyl-prolyl cis-trans isomerase [Chrysochromulina tobinii]|jgi:peptidylprolyl isomerase|uniref:peptidylprolyl isomerase n=1 Tax=Chrysochromulina tobinii TaxID=1460289 RepID=A0A0M0K5A9_9EUKA|nr:fkbp-type peptidyl-prolyl cis-trans isomerase [Chrysochromulina tobinii]|eukprot:KOO33995.1 fkbp-type peptidyl-prolyl cis-trans isomerase [Chrysochromulina sp. CCMP291]